VTNLYADHRDVWTEEIWLIIRNSRNIAYVANEDHERALFAGDNARYRETKLEA
jgi:hypothetical protein